MAKIEIGSKVRFRHPLPDGGILKFSARVVALFEDGTARVEIPKRVRSIPFPPIGGARFGRIEVSKLVLA